MQSRTKIIGYDELYLFSLRLYLVRFLFLGYVNWIEQLEGIVNSIGRSIYIINIVAFVALLLFSERTSIIWYILVALFSICMLLSYNNSGNMELLFTTLFALFSKDISQKKLFSAFWNTCIIIFVCCLIVFFLGLSTNRSVAFEYGIGHSLGMTHPNALAAFVLSLLLSWEIIRNQMRLNIRMLVVFTLAGVTTWLITLSRTFLYLVIIFPVMLTFINLTRRLKTERVLTLVRFGVLIMLIGSYYYMTNASMQTNLGDSGFRFRFAYPYRIFMTYGLHPFGISYSAVSALYANSVDSSYLYMLIFCGYIPTGIMIALIIWICRRCYKEGLFSLLAVISVYVLQGITEQYMIRIAFNCAYLLTLSEFDLFQNDSSSLIDGIECQDVIS